MDRDEAAKMREREARAARADRYKAVLEEIRDLQEEGFQSLTDQAMYYAEARELAILALGDPLAAVLDEIRQIEESEGFEGPKITGYISSVAAMQDLMIPKVVEDAIVGEIGRACDALGLEFMLKSSPSGHRAIITKWKQVGLDRWRPIFGAQGKGESRALAAAMAYRDALQASIMSKV